MSDAAEKQTSKPAKKKRKLLKICLITLVSIVVFLLVVFWLITTSGFITGVVLPAVSSAAGMRITADEVDLSLFKSTLRVKNVSVGSLRNPLVKAERFEGGFSLGDLINERFVFNDVLLDKAVINLSKDADGNWTYDTPDSKKKDKAEKSNKSEAKVEKSKKTDKEKKKSEKDKIFLNLKNIRITNSSLILDSGTENSPGARMELSDLNITLPEFVNNKSAELTLKAGLKIVGNGSINVKHGDWNLKLNVLFDDYMHPQQVKLDSDIDRLDGEINGVRINNSNLTIDIDADGNHEKLNVKKFCIRQAYGKWVKTNIESSSHITFEPFKIKGEIKVAPLSSEIISIVSQFARQVNPGKVGVNWHSNFEISQEMFSAAGKLKLSRKNAAVIHGKKYDLPDLNLRADYDFSFASNDRVLKVKLLDTELQESNKKVLSLKTDHPFTYFLNQKRIVEKQKPQVSLQLRQLDLKLLKLMRLPDKDFTINDGRLEGDIVLALGQQQKMLFGANIRALQLDFLAGGQRYRNLSLEQKMSGSVSKDMLLSIPKFQLAVNHKQKTIFKFKGTGNADLAKKQVEFSLGMSRFSTREIANLPLPEKQLKSIVPILNKLNPFVFSITSAGNVDLNKNTIAMKPVKCGIFQNEQKVAGISIKLHDGKIDKITEHVDLSLDFSKLELSQFNRISNDNSIKQGYLEGKIVGAAAKGFKSLLMKSSLSINDLQLLRGKQLIKDLLVKLAFTSEIKQSGQMQLQDFVCGVRQNKNLIMGLSGFGNMNPSAGTGKFRLTLDYLNYHFLNIIDPGHFRNGKIKGKLLVDILEDFKITHVQSTLDLLQIDGGALAKPLDGKAVADITLKPNSFVCRNFLLELRRKTNRLVHVSGSTTVPGERSGMPIVVNLQSKIIDIDKIKKLLNTKSETVAETESKNNKAEKAKKKTPEVKTQKPVSFDMGERKYVVNIDLRGIKYNSVLSSQVDGEITAQGKNISIKHLNIFNNKDKLAVNGDLLSTDKGLKYDVKIASDSFNLSPFFYTFLNNEFKSMKGTLKEFDFHLKGTGVTAPALWDNMRGFARSKFVDVKIPNAMSKTMIGKILLLPFETMIEVQKLMPSRALSSISKVSQFVVDFKNNVRIISFEDGKMDIVAENGNILIRDFRFSGKVVRSLNFYGELALGTHPMLDINSRLDISGIVLPVEIDGTVSDPQINYRKTTVSFMKSNALNVIDTTGKILQKGGGDVKKVLEGILDI